MSPSRTRARAACVLRLARRARLAPAPLTPGLRLAVIPKRTAEQSSDDEDHQWCTAICEHTGVAIEDLLRLETEEHDDTLGKTNNVMRHFVAVDHSTSTVVLALRGSASFMEIDAAGHAEPFCGGRAHAGMARMAQAVWRAAGVDVNAALDENDDYSLVVTGHSIGGGAAGLIQILLYHLRATKDAHLTAFFPRLPPPPDTDVTIRCFAFAPPPVFTPLVKAPHGSLANASAFVHARDCVPFLSVRAGRQLFAALHAVDEEHTSFLPDAASRAQVVQGGAPPPQGLVTLAGKRVAKLPEIDKAPELLMPASSFVWIRSAALDFGDAADAVSCDTTAAADAVLGGVPVAAQMLTDHQAPSYEAALAAMALATPKPLPKPLGRAPSAPGFEPPPVAAAPAPPKAAPAVPAPPPPPAKALSKPKMVKGFSLQKLQTPAAPPPGPEPTPAPVNPSAGLKIKTVYSRPRRA